MRFQVILLGVLFGLAAQATRVPTQSFPRITMVAFGAQQSLTGCVDEQRGQYILLNDRMLKIARLQSAGSDQEVFAKHVGTRVLVKGTQSSGQNAPFVVTSIETVPGGCGPANE